MNHGVYHNIYLFNHSFLNHGVYIMLYDVYIDIISRFHGISLHQHHMMSATTMYTVRHVKERQGCRHSGQRWRDGLHLDSFQCDSDRWEDGMPGMFLLGGLHPSGWWSQHGDHLAQGRRCQGAIAEKFEGPEPRWQAPAPCAEEAGSVRGTGIFSGQAPSCEELGFRYLSQRGE